MPWIEFTKAFDWSPPERRGRVTVAYKQGCLYFVRQECAVDALKEGAGVRRAAPANRRRQEYVSR